MKFTIEGERHVAEYLRHRPQVVVEVGCPPRLVARLRGLSDRDVAVRGQAGKRVVAELRLTPRYESELYAVLGAGRLGRVLVALDHVVDPHNLGAVVRSAAFFGVRGVVVARRRQVGLTAAVVNAARGGFALLDLFLVTNLARTLVNLKKRGFWVVGADMVGESLRDSGFFAQQVLVFGAEGRGISPAVRAQCDRLLCIEGGVSERRGRLQSLNVSAAAAIFLQQHSCSGS